MTTVSIVIRALNEAKWLGQAIEACQSQRLDRDTMVEIVLVDSGSTDDTLKIARSHGANIFHISKEDFTFGRSLNLGCESANGDILVFISAHCIPIGTDWLEKLIAPLKGGQCQYVYGGQSGLAGTTKLSEEQVFAHYFPEGTDLQQDSFFCNNANAAITRETWKKYRFDEDVTGLEDMVLAKAIVNDGGQIGYVGDAGVTHIHEETFQQTKRRYFREALVIRDIMPEVHFNIFDFLRCFCAGVGHDVAAAYKQKKLFSSLTSILAFRFAQYWGTYRGHNEPRVLSRAQKQSYYYPRPAKRSSTQKNSNRVADQVTLDASPKTK